MKLFNSRVLPFGFTALAVLALAGCGRQIGGSGASQVVTSSHEGHDHEGREQDGHQGHDHATKPMHGGWWCYEHGVPEEQCAMCDAKLASVLREQGDWCDEHIRPESLCFHCHPENAEPFIALYEAKFGEKPPESGELRAESLGK